MVEIAKQVCFKIGQRRLHVIIFLFFFTFSISFNLMFFSQSTANSTMQPLTKTVSPNLQIPNWLWAKYNVTVTNVKTGENVTRNLEIVKRIIENKDVTLDYKDGSKFVVRAIGDDGEPVGKGVVVVMKVNGKTYKQKTDDQGYARLTINLIPKKYTITSTYHGYSVKNKITVKQILKVKKTVKVKKSAKKLVLKATLKSSKGKAIKGKKITFKFKGKTYKAKTNKKGVAKVTIKKKVIKKLKKGKKYTYTAKYVDDYVKGKVQVK